MPHEYTLILVQVFVHYVKEYTGIWISLLVAEDEQIWGMNAHVCVNFQKIKIRVAEGEQNSCSTEHED